MSAAALKYKEVIARNEQELLLLRRRINLNALFRLLSFFGFGYFLFSGVMPLKTIHIMMAALCFGLFIFLVRWSAKMSRQKSMLTKLIFVNENELGLLDGGMNRLGDGESFRRGEGYADDLDVFGPGSLYHLLNRTTTVHGSQQLAEMLSVPMLTKDDIEKNQVAIQCLAPQVDGRQMITAGGLLIDDKAESLDSVYQWLSAPPRMIHKQWVMLLRWIFPFFSIVAIYVFLDTNFIAPLAIAFVLGWIFASTWAKYVGEQHQLIDKKQQVLNQYTSILGTFQNIDPSSSELLKELGHITASANKAIKRLSDLSSYFDQGHNKLVALFLKPFFLYDLHCLIALERWKEMNRDSFESWVKAVGEIESLNSLAAFAYNNPEYTYPKIESEGLVIEANAVAHPLIPVQERVTNDFVIGKTDRLQLVTGSNMSGKTTFLRTIGVNMILAQCGAPVCSGSFSFRPMAILTSIRISDSLQEHTSYFMAELKRLHKIIRQLQDSNPALVLIDEILRGTNSEDKTHGSQEFIQKLIGYNCVSLFATHDLILSKLSDHLPGVVSNFCFESSIRNNELYFDYKLQAGVAKNRNASFLMEKMGII